MFYRDVVLLSLIEKIPFSHGRHNYNTMFSKVKVVLLKSLCLSVLVGFRAHQHGIVMSNSIEDILESTSTFQMCTKNV